MVKLPPSAILRGPYVGQMDVVTVVVETFVVSDVCEKPLVIVVFEHQFLVVFIQVSASNSEIIKTKSCCSSCW